MRVIQITSMMSVIVLAACSPQLDLPQSARQALEERLLALPGGDTEFTIGQARPGVKPQSEPALSIEVWCVEVDLSPIDETSPELIWIVTRPNPQSDWTAAMLATMSAMWPYEACGGTE